MIADDIRNAIEGVATAPWNTSRPRDVPETADVALSNGAALLDATYLYADLADSSGLAQHAEPEEAARVIRMFLNMSVRVLKAKGGAIRSFDGDRVMAIFIGDSKNTNAFRAGLAIHHYVLNDMREAIAAHMPAVLDGWKLRHGVGIDTGEALVVRGGVRNHNDLVSIGSAPNVAAKLSEIRDLDALHITKRAGSRVKHSIRYGDDGRERMRDCNTHVIGGRNYEVRSSNWSWGL